MLSLTNTSFQENQFQESHFQESHFQESHFQERKLQEEELRRQHEYKWQLRITHTIDRALGNLMGYTIRDHEDYFLEYYQNTTEPYPDNFTEESVFSFQNSTEGFQTSTGYSNATNSSGYVPYQERPETYIVPVLFALIFVVGVIGNGTLILIFIRNKNLRNVPNTYIISLALGDLLVLFISVPFVSFIYTDESWRYGTLECKFSEMVRDVSVGVTVFTLTALSADRYMAIVSPVRKAVGAAGGMTLKVTVAIWVLSVLLATPTAVFSYVRDINVTDKRSFKVCYPYPDYLPGWYGKASVLTKAIIYYFLPLIIIGTFYLLMARHLLVSDVPGESHVFHRQIRTRRKVAKVVLCFVVIFAVCFLPSHVFLLWFYFDKDSFSKFNSFWHSLRIVGFCLSFINSCINPIALYCISGTFRKQYNRYLFCCCSWAKQERRSRNSMRSVRSGLSRYRSSTLRPSETITLTTLLQERVSPATS